MNAVLLCPGPSLANLYSVPKCDLSIAVNRACLRFDADWGAILDCTLLKEIAIRPPKLLTRREHWPRYTQSPGLAVEDTGCPIARYDLFTAPAALALAGYLGATTIDVYGADWTDEADFDGVRASETRRDAERWAMEIPIWNRVADWLRGKGCEVTRHGFHE